MGKVDFQIDSTQFLNSLNKYNNSVEQKLKDNLKKCAIAIEGDAKRVCPVDKGRLKGSITFDLSNVDNYEVSVGAHTDYAIFVEYGTYRQSPQPYMRPAFNKNVAKLETKIKDILGGK